ncbi:hypothetical protein [Hymenobacter swuensis]|uniref:Protein kinase domain-containing protein n=1 Tax=Hymenobacter swuensis DY53 TaxID=1227739 RepID=W8FAM1_9BACT|nr:hypothetical protein [Hymenobacter swuensis]AHJ99686.1 hypothetical protein Hsw_4091 [Hymenobacter swuensis DY53]
MDAAALLTTILSAQGPADVFSRRRYRQQYLAYLKLLHPDVCALPGAADAVARLNAYAEQFKALDTLEDDAGTIRRLDERTLRLEGDTDLLRRSYQNYQQLMAFSDAAARNFQRYLPARLEWQQDALVATAPHYLLPLSGLTVAPEHVGWILSRVLEFAAWLHQVGFCHAGFNPESLCVVPETHGIVCFSFYHLTPLNGPLRAVSGRYLNWYPPAVFSQKQATAYVDVSLVQRVALYLLGDPSGHGVKLKKTVDERLIDFLLTPHQSAFQTLRDYQELLHKVFGSRQFHPLEV